MALLAQLKPGDLARIIAIEGSSLQQKLSLRNIREGKFVRVISCQGPITIEVGRNVITIGKGMAAKIRVLRI